ncbi:MAG TPA: hypothetical protein VIG73_01520 [Cerasibacillus sp.]|uniref:hypothetical protein n=1 Tax=Cerasibacillus sp. TaxID=2498711 RepID=UPI002F3E6947
MIKPERLLPGDKIGIITPSTPAPVMFKERYERGISVLEDLIWSNFGNATAK